jgi:sulfate-transporting ATPase
VLEEVGFTLESGTVLGVIGPNGAGKTTLIDAITGFNVPRGGSIKLNGEKLTGLRPSDRSRRGIVRSFQSLELFEDLDVAENLLAATERPSWVRTLQGLVYPGRPRLDDAVAQVMRELKLDQHLHAAPRDLSYGDRRLLAIARAMAARPTVLLLDEPAAGLGELERTQLRAVIRMLAERWGTAVLLVEHDVDLVMDVSDQVLALDFGRTIAVGSPEEIRRHPAVIEAYLGTEEDLQVQEPAHGPLTGGPA